MNMLIHETERRAASIHPDAHVSTLAVVGAPGEHLGAASTHQVLVNDGAIIREFVRVHAGTERPTVIDSHALLMAGSHVGHDAFIGRKSRLCPNSVVCGHASIGENCIIYSGAVVSPFITMGNGAILAANSTATKDIPPNQVWGGSPARYIRDRA